jgi:hypothetical protein
MGENVFEKELQITNDAYIIAACAIDDGFDAQLVLVSNIDHSGIDRAGRTLAAIEVRRLPLWAAMA